MHPHRLPFAAALALLLASSPGPARAQVDFAETGFLAQSLSNDLSKQVEIAVGGMDTCIYYGSFDGLMRRCGPFDTPVVCDPALTFPVGIAFSNGGSFGNYMYVADYGLNDIWRSPGCATAANFATVLGPGSIAFPPAGSAYGEYLYACQAFDGPIFRVSSTGAVTTWLALEATYLRFGPGGAWGTELYSTSGSTPGEEQIVRISAAGAVTPVATEFWVVEGFDWGFDGDLFAADMGAGEIYRVKPDGTKTLFASLAGAADVAWRAGEQALYVVSNQGGFYRIIRSGTSDAPRTAPARLALAVAPNPARGDATLHLSLPAGGLAQVQVLDAAGRMVRRLPETWRPAGDHAVAWDGRDAAGAPVRAGTYFMRVVFAGEMRSAAVTILR